MTWTLAIELLALGACAGFLAGLMGIGGGMMMVPFLTMILDARPGAPAKATKMAIATSMSTIVFTSVSSLRAHHARGAVRWSVVARMAPGILVGGLVGGAGVFAALHGQAIGLAFAAFVGVSAWRMLRGRAPTPHRQLPGTAAQAGMGSAIGLLSGLVGAGGGFLSVPFLTWCNVPIHEAVATSAALGFPIALANTLGYVAGGWQLPPALPGAFGYLYLPALACIAVGSVALAPVGARAAHALDLVRLRQVFAGLLAVIAGWMLWRIATH